MKPEIEEESVTRADRRYARLREELASFVADFREMSARHPALFCERLFDGKVSSEEGWRRFALGAVASHHGGRWVVLPGGEGCLRFHGDLGGFDAFRGLASAAWLVLAALESDCRGDLLDLGRFTHEVGWVDRVFQAAESVATARLHVAGDWWDWDACAPPEEIVAGDRASLLYEGEGEERRPRHPMVQRLPLDVFRSSAEAIRAWLGDEPAPAVADRLDDLAIRLPCGSPSRAHVYDSTAEKAMKPRWDEETQTLWWGAVCLKRFATQARVLTLLMRAFEQAGWAKSIPVPPDAGDQRNVARALEKLEFDAPGMVRFGCRARKAAHDSRAWWTPVAD